MDLFAPAKTMMRNPFLLVQNAKVIPGGTRTPNLLIRSQTPCPIGPQGLGNTGKASVRAQKPFAPRSAKNAKDTFQGAAGIEPATAGSAILCSTAELYTLDVPAKHNRIRSRALIVYLTRASPHVLPLEASPGSCSVMVITKDSESFDPGSSPGRT